jgi:predicted amidohydrolase YtcJ
MKSSFLLHGAALLSFHPEFRKGADSMVVENGIIKAVGKINEFQSYVDSGIPMLDGQGKTVMPGFNDTHIHVWKAGNLKTFMLDLRTAESLDHMLSMLSDYHRRFPQARWITARGFNEMSWDQPVFPTKSDLDKVTSTVPMYVIHTSAHSAVANSRALEIASVGRHSLVPDGGEMQLGRDGLPTGIFSETAMGLISTHIPPYSKAELKTMFRAAREEMYRYGITAATDPAVDPLLLEAYQEMNQDQTLGLRLQVIPILLPDGADTPNPVPDYFDSAFLKLKAVKFFSDGGLSNQTAALWRPYKQGAGLGILRLKRDRYLGLCQNSMDRGLRIATHAIGDRAIDFVLDVYRELSGDFPGMSNRIEHLGLPSPQNLKDMAEYRVATSMQSIFIYELGRNFVKCLDEDYLNRCYPVKSVLREGILMALSSDAPVVQDFNPLKGVEAAVSRKNKDGVFIAREESISVSQALQAYTTDAARLSQETALGILDPGKQADFIVMNENPLQVAVDRLGEIKIEKTFVSGELVWSASAGEK